MSNFRSSMIFFLMGFFFIGSLNAANQQNMAYRNFWHPTFHGERLNYCTLDGAECGEKVANRYCQMLGYGYASQHAIAYNLGLTNILSSRAQCRGWQCNGFMTINCVTHLSHAPAKPYHYREQEFLYPRYNEYRIDWCYDQHQGCGLKAAHSFCTRMGFMKAKRFVKETQVSATKTIGSQELCFGNQCNAFKMIVCYR